MQNPQINSPALVVECLAEQINAEIAKRYPTNIQFNNLSFRQHLKQVSQTGVADLEPFD